MANRWKRKNMRKRERVIHLSVGETYPPNYTEKRKIKSVLFHSMISSPSSFEFNMRPTIFTIGFKPGL